jgi:hypothetical protein
MGGVLGGGVIWNSRYQINANQGRIAAAAAAFLITSPLPLYSVMQLIGTAAWLATYTAQKRTMTTEMPFHSREPIRSRTIGKPFTL